MKKHAVVIGSGIGGLGTACLLAKEGYAVTVVEKNDRLGGRAGVFSTNGYRFDMGPSWYLMPDVFERFFNLIGEPIEKHLTLQKLSPSYRIFFSGDSTPVDIEADVDKAAALFEQYEEGAGAKLRDYLDRSGYQYGVAIKEFMYKNYNSIFDFFTKRTMVEGRKLSVFSSMDSYVRKFFTHPRLQKILQYQLVFLGSSPYETPALYNVMNHIDFSMGVYYPKGGIYAIIEALTGIARSKGVTLRTSAEVSSITVENKVATGVTLTTGEFIAADLVISNADIAHTETKLLPEASQSHTKKYWGTRTLAPSAFILYLGIDGRVDSLTHHNLLFTEDWKLNFDELFHHPGLPKDPSLYICCPSKTDATVAPEGKENLFVLVPIGAGVSYTEEALDRYQEQVLEMIETQCNIPGLRSRIEFLKRYGPEDFGRDYYSLGNSALGIAHTLKQTSAFRPNNVSKKVSNLYYVGAGTNPGIGMPTCLISAELAYKRIMGITTPEPLGSLRTQTPH